MKIASFNVNGIAARLPVLLRWLAERGLDVACLQELKMPDERFPRTEIEAAGYGVVWHGQKSWNGVAILARGAEPIERRRALPGDPEDLHSRYIEASIGSLVIGCLYLPNGNPAPGPRFAYKLGWIERLLSHAEALIGAGERCALAGDYNIIPTEFDVYAPERWLGDALFRPEVRERFRRLLEAGWVDGVRKLHPTDRCYTFWKYLRNSFERDAGLRIDHLLLSAQLAASLQGGGVDREVRGWQRPSDHAPVWVEIANPNPEPPTLRGP